MFAPYPDEGVIKFGVDRFQILNGQFLAQHTLVEWQRETSINKLAMEKCLPRETKALLKT